MANQNFRVKNGLEVGVGGTILYAKDTGRIGIGLTNPSAELEVRSTADAPTLTWNGSGQTIIGDTANQLSIGRVNSFPFGLYLQARASNNAARDILLNPVGGDVGIGTNNPIFKLDLRQTGQADLLIGSYNAGGARLILDGDSDGDGSGGDFCEIVADTSGDLTINARNPASDAEMIFKTGGGTERLRITSSGIINSNNYSLNSQGTNTASSVYLGAFAPGSSAYAIATNGVERLRINSSGNLGIATDSPSQKLDVNGGARFRGAIYDNNNAVGAANSVLSSTGSGVQWVSVSAGSDADTLDGLDSSQFLRSDTDDDAQGFGSRANVNTTGDPGLLITSGGRLGFDQSGTRSWTIKATGGNLAIASGDGSGSLTYNSNTVWHAGNHGSGSGLDADFLDGISSASFLRSDTGDTFTGTVLSIESTTDGKLALKCPSGDTSDWNYIEYYGTNGTRDGYVGTNSSGLLHVSQDGGSTLEMSTTSGLAYLNSNKIWTAGNDGSGSGLDADTVDGIQASSFLRSDAADIATGPISWTGTLATFDPGGSPGTDTATDVALALESGHRLAGHYNGYLRTLLEWNSGSDIDIGQSGTSLIAGINLIPGSSGVAKVNGNTIWHAGNDGSGSGLDADTVDGIQGASFLRSDADDTATGTLTVRDIKFSAGYHLQRSDHHSGHLEGSYNNVGANSYKTNPIYTIGSNYNPNDDTLSNMYGIGYSHTNASFISFTGASGWGMYVAADGDARIYLSATNGVISSTGDHYVGSSKVWHAGNDGAGSGVDADNLDGYTWGSSGKDLRGTEIYADNWFRNYDSGEGLYNQANGNHWYSDAANYWNATLGGSSNGGIRIRDSHAGTVRGYVYADTSNNIGFLNGSGSWRIRVVGGDYTNINGSSIRAPLFYDIDNTGYYVNPASTSVINTTYIGSGGVRFEYGNNNRNLYVKGGTSNSDVGISLFDNNGNHRVQLYGDSGTNYGFLNGNWASWDLRKTKTGNMYLNNQSTYYYGTSETYMSRVYGITDIRSPIYYDYNDTGYYTNPASTSRMNAITPNIINSPYSGGNSGITRSSYAYSFGFQESGAWSSPYPDLVLQYHTGVTLAANPNYDGITFKADYNNDTVIFRVNGSSNYLYKYYWMYTNTSGFYSNTNSAHLHPNTTTNYGVWRIQGTRNSYTGIVYENADSTVSGMFDGSGNGGDYNHSTGWHYYYHRGNDCLGVSGSATSGAYELYVSGDIYATGTITAASDARLKRNIETIESPLDKVLKLRGVTYEWDLSKAKKRKKGTKMGLIAQEVVEVVPEVVTYAEDVDEYSVEYGNLTALLIEAVKEQNEIINTMRQEINDLKSKLGE